MCVAGTHGIGAKKTPPPVDTIHWCCWWRLVSSTVLSGLYFQVTCRLTLFPYFICVTFYWPVATWWVNCALLYAYCTETLDRTMSLSGSGWYMRDVSLHLLCECEAVSLLHYCLHRTHEYKVWCYIVHLKYVSLLDVCFIYSWQGWHCSDSGLPVAFGAWDISHLSQYAPYLARMLTLLNHSSRVSLRCTAGEEGTRMLAWLQQVLDCVNLN